MCDSHGIGEVQNGMPPTIGNIDCFPGMLGEFEATKVLVLRDPLQHASLAFDAWENK